MLPKELRLSPKEILQVVRFGRKLHHELFDVKVLQAGEKEENTQFAISVSIKILHNATARNTAKRRIREAIISLSREAKLKPGKYLVIVRSEKITAPGVDVQAALASLLNQP